jgi:alpha-1,3-rhamnosyl/mannosyltransferase
MARLRICLWSEALVTPPTGTGTLLENLVRAWIQNHGDAVEVTLACPEWGEQAQLPTDLAHACRVERVAGGKWPTRLAWLAGGASLSDRLDGHDVYLSGWHWPLGGRDRPFVGIVHDVRTLHPHWSEPGLSPFKRAIVRRLARNSLRECLQRAAAIVAPSRFTLEDMESLGFARRQPAWVIPHGVNLNAWRSGKNGERAAVLARYGLSPKTPYVLGLGQHTPHKNFPRLVEAFAAGPARIDADARLVLAGGYNVQTELLRGLAARAGLEEKVRLLGPLAGEDLAALMSGARIFAFPSLFEGFGIPVIEAFAAGTAVVCSTAASLSEVAGDAAVMVDPEDVASITGGLIRVWTDLQLRRELATRGARRAETFSWGAAARRYLEVCAQAAGGPALEVRS